MSEFFNCFGEGFTFFCTTSENFFFGIIINHSYIMAINLVNIKELILKFSELKGTRLLSVQLGSQRSTIGQ